MVGQRNEIKNENETKKASRFGRRNGWTAMYCECEVKSGLEGKGG